MNSYFKFAPNVFIAKCSEEYKRNETIVLATKYGKEHECIVFNLVEKKEGFFYYSIVRADGFNTQEWAKKRAEKLQGYALNAENKSTNFFNASNKDRNFLSLGEPIKIGHHSERRHRKIIELANSNMQKCVEFSKKVESYENRVEYWSAKANTINLSMPESLEFYEFELEKATALHHGLKSGTIKVEHSFSLAYAKKHVNVLQKQVNTAKLLWA